MEKIWELSPKMPASFRKKFPEYHPVILQLLYNRDLKSKKEVEQFLSPNYLKDLHDPFLFKDMKKVVDRIYTAIEKKEKIVLWTDSDTDGATSATLLENTLKKLGASNLEVYVPDREKDGYGLNEKEVKKFAQQKVNLIITSDCGITSKDEVILANKLGLSVIITDHHREPPELPPALAIINPHLSREKYPNQDLAAVGVVFKLAQALLLDSRCPISHREAFEKWLLDLVAVGTIVDSMSLLGENRTLVKYGLIVLNKTTNLGLRNLISRANLNLGDLDTRSVSHQIGPRLNVSSRIGQANGTLKLLLADDQRSVNKFAEELDLLNKERQRLVKEIFTKIISDIGPETKEKILVVISQDLPSGLLGLISNRLVDRYARPALVINQKPERIKGSGRSISGFNLYQVISSLKKYFIDFGGHAEALGFTIKDSVNLEDFKKEVFKIGEKALKSEVIKVKVTIEAEIDLEDINWSFHDELIKFKPYGRNNPEHNLLIKNVSLDDCQMVGKSGQHCRMVVNGKIKMIYFGAGDRMKEFQVGDTIDVIFQLSINQWNGQRKLQIKVIDLKKSK
ncbi:single-stranded-DNA-specific exonuclease RecJ [Patescibacteria group bacterium]|nr:single-stranded-DNA-specific exonuclease RecJ [Patescibacteria group bacterium]